MPTIKGTASVCDDHAMAKMLRSTKFPRNFSTQVNMQKVNFDVMSKWIENQITSILGFDDEIVQSTAINLFLPQPPPSDSGGGSTMDPVDPRRAQLDLAGFLGEAEAASFAEELWTLLIDAQKSQGGIPRVLVEKKKAELARQQASGGAGGAAHHGYNAHKSGLGANHNPEMNQFLIEATRRAEAARRALASQGGNMQAAVALAGGSGGIVARPPVQAVGRGGPYPPPERSVPVPVPVSPSREPYKDRGGARWALSSAGTVGTCASAS
uniref:PWI domain-containing protein n=1 Tax=Ditylum brightwellii TaxID=49249 RepID=A0A7S4VST2_9STRA